MSSVVAFVQLAAPAIVVTAVTALACLILLTGFIVFMQPILDWMTKPSGGFLGGLIRWVTKPIAATVIGFRHWWLDLLTRTFNGASEPLVRLLNQTALLTELTYRTLGDLSLETWRAIETVRTQTIPREINRVLAPIRTTIANHTRRLDTLEHLNQQVAAIVGTGLRSLPWGATGTYVGNIDRWWDSYRHLWDQVFTRITPKLAEVLSERLPELERAVVRLTARLDALTETGIGALGARVTAVETRLDTVLEPGLAAVTNAVDVLTEMVTGAVGTSLTALFDRVAQLEAQMEALIGTTTANLAERLTALETEVRTEIAVQLETLRQTVATLAEEIYGEIGAGLELLVGRIIALETWRESVVMPELQRLGAILEPVAFAALVLATMTRVAPNLFCRNTTKATQAVCAQSDSTIDGLLAMLLAVAAVGNLEWYVRGMQETIGTVAGVVHAALDPTNRSEIPSEAT